ncbi:2-succinyl-5-enolpyruvyl-6-hydroxy-3-cyclohexene-1-carboxylic-acid synthase [Leptobacterium flavescens]|uniref:2-succinyl-5-enolpyruvyl-6-hydroxy-3-cyclohexene-1-carboxylate synthase n=1 Tax=Leptobacterium flavescens TaxID=472055 RepID=A0A6P0UPK0_9FLAO|nr:2-succinyl-5-enolpyruvyl-6-hydroxy-3-cyclohexene-1-carboxylic-acid synthase [Leptobacterium flavescens]NER13888.1 2-succinyl-5-enolpyruvyl-6-hydroxy-3-cyclohexene-1-carboxylic-acid synthase [Leptobacterium flavescens]
MKYPAIPLAQSVIQLCKQYKITHIVISPGSRNAPLTMGFYEDDFFTCYSIVDERCAAFFAMGIAQQTKSTVAVVCTSGSALLNYYPAVSEAFYSDIPLAVISADRPSAKIDIGDGQTIRQPGVFSNHILYTASLNEDPARQQWNEEEINKALGTAAVSKGPVHINVPFEEPLYETTDKLIVPAKRTELVKNENDQEQDFSDFINCWNDSKKKMVLVGVNSPDQIDQDVVDWLGSDPSVVVFTETTSNLHHPNFFPGIDKIIAPIEKIDEEIKKLQPDMLITLGGMIVSKKIKAFLRKYKPACHIHIDTKKAYDTFFCLKQHIRLTPENFFRQQKEKLKTVDSNYRAEWLKVQEFRRERHKLYLEQIPFSDLRAYHFVLNSLPDNYQLQLSNSSTVRYTQLFDLNKSLKVFCNRGTSGIDGSTSTAIGAAVISDTPTTLISGDLSFFYDSNALWNNYIPEDFRIIVFNNQGGGIFRILPGPKGTDNFDTYFETTHHLNAKSLCGMYNIEYSSANDENTLTEKLKDFYTPTSNPKLLEVFTPREVNDRILIDYFGFLNENFQ